MIGIFLLALKGRREAVFLFFGALIVIDTTRTDAASQWFVPETVELTLGLH